ncbi:MAG: ATP-binding cassette domain-containing protein [Micrococcales bacterium]|nr:ATP-binding cassette domain-containing protein [Micrococcales bacterium]
MLLDSITWQVFKGEHWVVLGPNGAGKTTLMQVAGARLHPTSGTAHILGHKLGRVDVFSLRPRIGLASDALTDRIPHGETALDAVVTAVHAVTGRWREVYSCEDLDRAQALLDLFNVGDLARRSFGTLSEGERKRVQIARALMSNPEVLLLDEPSAGLDLAGREDLLAALTALADAPSSPVMVLVTHHVEEIPAGFTHMGLLREGRFTAAGPIRAIATPIHLSTAFGIALDITEDRGRWTARAAGPQKGPSR